MPFRCLAFVRHWKVLTYVIQQILYHTGRENDSGPGSVGVAVLNRYSATGLEALRATHACYAQKKRHDNDCSTCMYMFAQAW